GADPAMAEPFRRLFEAFGPREGADPQAERFAKTTFRLRMPDDVALFCKELEVAHADAGLPGRFLQWACLTFWQTWAPSLPTKLKWGNVYRRDRYRCISPVCDSRNITPHHMKYKSAGGTDDDENMGSVCHTEHLDLIHTFRSLRLYPPASHPTWVFGKDKTLFVVEGREKRAGNEAQDERATA
ncbi:MAG: HNH endonuclease, partial [Polyangiales bacterium]